MRHQPPLFLKTLLLCLLLLLSSSELWGGSRQNVLPTSFGEFYDEHRLMIWSMAIVFCGFLLLVVGLCVNIIRRRRTESVLQAQFNQMNTIFDSINAVVYVADMETNQLLYLNSYGITLFGDDWKGRSCYEVLQSGANKICSYCTNNRLVENGRPQPPCIWEFENVAAGRWFQCIDRAITWTDGRLVRLEIAFDITDHKEMEQMKDEMISAVSHEMRTPLTAMLGYTAFLLEHSVDPHRQKTYLQTMQRETQRLNELIGNFLTLQRQRARRDPLNFQPLSLQPLLKETITLFSGISPLHHFSVDCPPDLPQIRGNAGQLRQVFNNLVSNAVKYSPKGGEILLGVRREDDGVTILVRDEGCGIPPEARERIFDRFYRLDNTDRRATGGAGLGLALVREIVNAHGGRVWVESTVGKGSTFYVKLPAL